MRHSRLLDDVLTHMGVDLVSSGLQTPLASPNLPRSNSDVPARIRPAAHGDTGDRVLVAPERQRPAVR